MEIKKIKRLRQLLNEFILLYGIRPKDDIDKVTKLIALEYKHKLNQRKE